MYSYQLFIVKQSKRSVKTGKRQIEKQNNGGWRKDADDRSNTMHSVKVKEGGVPKEDSRKPKRRGGEKKTHLIKLCWLEIPTDREGKV